MWTRAIGQILRSLWKCGSQRAKAYDEEAGSSQTVAPGRIRNEKIVGSGLRTTKKLPASLRER